VNGLAQLRERVAAKESRVVVVGLGYVGIPVAVSFAAAGFDVTGVDPAVARVEALARGTLPLATSEPGLASLLAAGLAAGRFHPTSERDGLAGADVIIVAVDSPLVDRAPDLRQLETAARDIAGRIAAPCAVVIETTLPPGTMRTVLAPLFGGGTVLIHCPERVRPGRLLRNLRGMARLVGADDATVGLLGAELYRNVVEADLIVTDWETAEVIKTAENAARDVQIALANQLAVVCDHVGVDFRRVRDQINRLWSGEPLVMEAGAGVGGHCLPKDPWLLVSTLPEDVSIALIEGARSLNDAMPAHAARIALHALARAGRAPSDATICVLGLTYDANSDDERNAPGPRVAARLRDAGVTVRVHDPYAAPGPLEAIARDADALVVVTPHAAYRDADWRALARVMRGASIVDCRRAFEADALRGVGFSYYGLGMAALR